LANGVPVDVTVTAVGSQTADELRSLRQWPVAEEELRGRVRLVERAPEPGMLGALTDTLTVALGPGGVAAVFADATLRGHLFGRGGSDG
jgi:membrane-associated two-gene conflict system component 1 (EACC1)